MFHSQDNKGMKSSEKNILRLREEHASCSNATLVGLARTYPDTMPDEKILKRVSAALRGGIGRTFDEGTCGALTGAVIALGLIYPDDENKACLGAKMVYERFKDHFGTVCCGRITDEFGKKRCNECCVTAGRLVDDFVNG